MKLLSDAKTSNQISVTFDIVVVVVGFAVVVVVVVVVVSERGPLVVGMIIRLR